MMNEPAITLTIPTSLGTHKSEEMDHDKKRKRAPLPKSLKTKSITVSAKAQSLVYKYSIDPYDHSDDELIEASIEMFRHFQLLEKFYLDEENVLSFMQAVRDLYTPSNHFHNFKHAWGVMHMSFQILLLGASQCLRDIDLLAILLSAVCHDVGHPGNNNAFEIATDSEVSKKYRLNDEICVLERYHSALTKTLLFSENELLKQINNELKEQLLEEIHYIIMGTDMAKHGLLVEEAQEYVRQYNAMIMITEEETTTTTCRSESEESGLTTAPCTPTYSHTHPNTTTTPINTMNSKKLCGLFPTIPSQMAFARILIHTADIGAQTQDIPMAKKWVWRCYNEFRVQADKECHLGIMTSPFLHDLKEDSKIYKSQYYFINDIVEPIWYAMIQLLPSLSFAYEQLIKNKIQYQTIYDTITTTTNTTNTTDT